MGTRKGALVRREAEAAERRKKQLQEMLMSLKKTPPPKQRVKDLKIAPLRDDEDTERYLTLFERIAAACDWEKSTWAVRLAAVLTGKAKDAHANIDTVHITDYNALKAAILKRYDIDEETTGNGSAK